MSIIKKVISKIKLRSQVSKSERLIYIVIFLWVIFGVLGILKDTNMTQLAGYYASLTLFISTYLWGEYKRTSQATKVFTKGANSSREVVILITVFLWAVLGGVGIFFMKELNSLTVYFSSLSPFVISYIIYKTSKGADLPIFDGSTQNLIDEAKKAADVHAMKDVRKEVAQDGVKQDPKVEKEMDKIRKDDVDTEEPKDNEVVIQITPVDDNKDSDGI